MNKRIGFPIVNYAPEGGADAIPWTPAQGADPAAPWAVGGKPWWEATVTGDDDVAKGTRSLMGDKKYRDPSVLARSYYELNRENQQFKASAVQIPGENATPEQWNAYYKKLGRPDNPEGYKDVKWGDKADPRMVKFASELAFDLGVSPKMAESVLAAKWNKFVGELDAEEAQAAKTRNEQYIANLKTQWGGEYETNLAQGNRVMEALKKNGMSDEDFAAIEAAVGVPQVVRLLATLGKLTGEAGFIGSGGGGGNADVASMSPEQATAEINRLNNDAAFQKQYTGKNEPGHADAVKRMEALYAKAG